MFWTLSILCGHFQFSCFSRSMCNILISNKKSITYNTPEAARLIMNIQYKPCLKHEVMFFTKNKNLEINEIINLSPHKTTLSYREIIGVHIV